MGIPFQFVSSGERSKSGGTRNWRLAGGGWGSGWLAAALAGLFRKTWLADLVSAQTILGSDLMDVAWVGQTGSFSELRPSINGKSSCLVSSRQEPFHRHF